MQKEIKLGDKVYTLSTNAYTPIAYKKEFGKDYFQDLFNMLSAESIMNQLEQLEEGEVLKAKDIDMSILSDFDMTFFTVCFGYLLNQLSRRLKPMKNSLWILMNFQFKK